MGVRGLTSYVDSLPTGKGEVWETYELCDTKLVIDGNGLYHNLYSHYNLDCKYGGQYCEYEEKVKEFFTKLSSHGVQPYVVFDGILDKSGKKLQTVKERKAERIKRARDLWKSENGHYDRFTMTLPLLTQLTLIKVLQDLRVPYAVADFEADHDIASLANEFHGPVMGQDSDYFIFNIQEGYIPFSKFEFSGPSMTTKRFHSARLANHLNINSTMLPMLASLVGNDYVSDEILKPFKTYAIQTSGTPYRGNKGTILAMAEFLSGCESLEDAIADVIEKSPGCKKPLKKVLRLSVDEYQLTSTNLRRYFKKHKLHSNLETYNEHALPKWVIGLYREGGIAEQCINCWCHRKVFLKVQVEDMSKPSANQCTLKIRKFLYKIFMKHDERVNDSLDSVDSDEDLEGGEVIIKEYDREGLSLTSHKHVLATAETKVDISNIPTMEKHTKVTYLLNVLSCDLSSIQHLPESHQLVVAALKYWVINTTPPVTEVHLASILVYYVGVNDNQIQWHDLDARGLHGFAQWQNVVYWVYYLNSVFGNEFPSLDPVRLYDGVNVCKLYQKLKASGTIVEIVGTFVSDIELFKQLYNAVVQKLPDDITSNLLRRASGKKSKETKKQKEMKTKSERDFLRGNQFELLCLSSDTDED